MEKKNSFFIGVSSETCLWTIFNHQEPVQLPFAWLPDSDNHDLDDHEPSQTKQ